MSIPLVSVVIPVYNAEKYIEQTIRSVLQQTEQDFEIIVLSDGSKDSSGDIIKSLQQVDKRLVYITKTNSGVSDTRNMGIGKAKGKYIAFLDADDVWLPDNLKRKIEALQLTGKKWVFSDHEMIDENNRLLPQQERQLTSDNILSRLLLWEKGDVVPGPCSNIIAERRLFEEGVRFDTSLSSPADRDIAIQLAAKGEPAIVNDCLWQYRIHSQSMSSQNLKVANEVTVFINKMKKSTLYPDAMIKRKSLSNLYYMLAGYYNNNGYKLRALKYIFTAFYFSPANVWNRKIKPAFTISKK
jgi:glycosyltransferase involved in cell wall biosynthesis